MYFRSPLLTSVPKATSSPSISDEQRERILQNRRLAEERRLARLKNNTFNSSTNSNTEISTTVDLTSVDKSVDVQSDTQHYKDTRIKKSKKSYVIDSDDDDGSDDVSYRGDCNNTEANETGNNTNINNQNNIAAPNAPTELIDITEGYEFRNNKSNRKINEVVDLVNTGMQDTNITIGNYELDSSDDECDLNSVNIAITVDVHKSGSKNTDITEEYENEVILENSKKNSETSSEKELSEKNSVEVIPNETEESKGTINANEDLTNFQNENVNELGTIDKENIDCNVAERLGLDDLMDVDFCSDF